jgi:hypothetical protein
LFSTWGDTDIVEARRVGDRRQAIGETGSAQ